MINEKGKGFGKAYLLGGGLVVVEEGDSLVDGAGEGLLVLSRQLLLGLGVGDGVAERVGVRLEAVLGLDAASLSLVLVSASASMRSISSLERRPLSLVMTILLVLPVPFSRAETFMIPLASRSKVTSI
jgi:hypothetical protein